MIIFQRSISFGGTTAEPAQVNTTLVVPTLFLTADAGGQISRQFGGDTTSVAFTQPADETRYQAALPETFLTGTTEESAAQAAQFFRTALTAADLDALTVQVSVRYRSADGQVLGEQALDVLVLPKLTLDSDPDLTNRARTPGAKPGYFVVNKARFLALRRKLASLDDDTLVLLAVSCLTNLVDDSPTFAESAVDTVEAFLESRSSAAGQPDSEHDQGQLRLPGGRTADYS